ncbi:MAG: hypothetical protein HOQ33_21680 [Cupriavidus sp.]|nr:hypothetical protein [Cupriavidus sp.]
MKASRLPQRLRPVTGAARSPLFPINSGRAALVALAFAALAGCGGDADAPAPVSAKNYSVGGSVSGLKGSGLVLRNGSDALQVPADGAFAFAAPVAPGSGYAVTVASQPAEPSQLCSVNAGTGTVAHEDVRSVEVVCSTQSFAVGGTVAGLIGAGLVLQNNAGDDLGVSPASARFTFPMPVASAAHYAVTVKTQPAGQTCTVNDGTGKMGSLAIGNVKVVCADMTYAVGGTVRGLIGGKVMLRNNAGPALAVGNGQFMFPDGVAGGAAYAVTVSGLDLDAGAPQQTCSVNDGAGVVGASAVANVDVVCSVESFKVKGSVSGLVAAGLVLQNNAGDDLAVSADGAFEFAAPVASASSYAVTIKSQPRLPTQICTVGNGTGVVAAADIADVTVTCIRDSATIALIGVGGAQPAVEPRMIGANGTVGAAAAPGGATPGVPAAIDASSKTRTVNVAVGSSIQQFAVATPASAGLNLMNTLTTVSGQVVALRSDPNGRALLAATDTGAVETYLLDPESGLSTTPLPAHSAALAPVSTITFEPTGRFVYFTHSSAAYVSQYELMADGRLRSIGVAPIDTPAFAAAMHPDGLFYYATNLGTNRIFLYVPDAVSGGLRPNANYGYQKAGHMAVSADGKFLYVGKLNIPGAPAITRYAITAFGGISSIGATTITLQGASVANPRFEVDPSNLHLYALTGDRLETYSIQQATGDLAFVSSTPVGNPATFALSNAR